MGGWDMGRVKMHAYKGWIYNFKIKYNLPNFKMKKGATSAHKEKGAKFQYASLHEICDLFHKKRRKIS